MVCCRSSCSAVPGNDDVTLTVGISVVLVSSARATAITGVDFVALKTAPSINLLSSPSPSLEIVLFTVFVLFAVVAVVDTDSSDENILIDGKNDMA